MLPKCLIMLTSKTLFLALFSLPIVHAMNKMKLNLLQVKEEVGESVSKVTLDLHLRIMWSLKRVKQAKLWKL
jgi:hypothetical protein